MAKAIKCRFSPRAPRATRAADFVDSNALFSSRARARGELGVRAPVHHGVPKCAATALQCVAIDAGPVSQLALSERPFGPPVAHRGDLDDGRAWRHWPDGSAKKACERGERRSLRTQSRNVQLIEQSS